MGRRLRSFHAGLAPGEVGEFHAGEVAPQERVSAAAPRKSSISRGIDLPPVIGVDSFKTSDFFPFILPVCNSLNATNEQHDLFRQPRGGVTRVFGPSHARFQKILHGRDLQFQFLAFLVELGVVEFLHPGVLGRFRRDPNVVMMRGGFFMAKEHRDAAQESGLKGDVSEWEDFPERRLGFEQSAEIECLFGLRRAQGQPLRDGRAVECWIGQMLDDGSDRLMERHAVQRRAEVGPAVEHDRFATADLAAEPRDDLDRFDRGTDRRFFRSDGEVERYQAKGSRPATNTATARSPPRNARTTVRAFFGARCRARQPQERERRGSARCSRTPRDSKAPTKPLRYLRRLATSTANGFLAGWRAMTSTSMSSTLTSDDFKMS